MTALEARIAGEAVEPSAEWRLEWVDRDTGRARLVGDSGAFPVIVEGGGSEWFVTLRGRRIQVTVLSWRERLLAEAAAAVRVDAGPVTVKATLPGLVVAVRATAGETVTAGELLVTIEAMKMQNEVRAPRDGRVLDVFVAAGQPVATGAPLLKLE